MPACPDEKHTAIESPSMPLRDSVLRQLDRVRVRLRSVPEVIWYWSDSSALDFPEFTVVAAAPVSQPLRPWRQAAGTQAPYVVEQSLTCCYRKRPTVRERCNAYIRG